MVSKYRQFILVATSLSLLLAVCHGAAARRIPLAGEWRFALDPQAVGETENWYRQELADTVTLPGTVAGNHKGPHLLRDEGVQQLGSAYPYEGIAWYQRTILIPETWSGAGAELFLERSKPTKVWLDDLFLGEQNALGVPHIYPIRGLSSGAHRLTVRVDGKIRPFGAFGHMITNSTQTNWNGLIGDLHLERCEPIRIQRARVIPDILRKTAVVTLWIENSTGVQQPGRVLLIATPFNVSEAKDRKPASALQSFTAAPGGTTLEVILPLGEGALLWDEFHPALYRLEVNLEIGAVGESRRTHIYQDEFGMREFKTAGGQFTVNGRPVFLRGKHDALVFPVQGHVAMDLAEWTRVLSIAKSYGINHYRFHSCTPPEAAFLAADRLGIYLQPELYNFGGTYPDGEAAAYHLAEGKRILTSYANHPSFVMFALGNEIGDGREIRARAVDALRQFDPTRLYAQGSNNQFGRPTLASGDDYWTTARTSKDSARHAVRGSFSHADKPLGHIQSCRPATRHDYRAALLGVPVPVIGHEVGQFQVFPDFREIAKYTGVQKPWNLETFRRRLDAADMLDQADAFVAASGALALRCYREEIETALRTPGFGGFQLLDLQDFPGQGTALVGILNAFMESKGLISPEAWSRFCGPVVPLARMDRYTWTSAQSYTAEIEVAQYGSAALPAMALAWSLDDAGGKSVASGSLPPRDYPQGALVPAGTLTIPLAGLPVPACYALRLSLPGTSYQNDYPLWIYPEKVETATPPAVTIRRTWDGETRALLAAGKSVLLLPSPASIFGVDGFFTPDFWCFPMFRNICEGGKNPEAPGTLGLWIDASHPALARFPTATHSDWQWWDLITGSRALILDATPATYRPIVQGIDNFERNHKLGYLFEAKVGPGSLLVCTLDLLHKQESPVARQMLASLLDHARTAAPPRHALPPETIDAIFTPPKPVMRKNPDGSFSEFFERKE
ncbi:MAG: glycoside hydrolase family 2 TIM barrel-domain containing protein [Luteolibacter sp.]|jgi:hypothetical protein|nr:glycoside hydrolase family 2 TIM barrel-domain containing protein [Luteolibacter sp.]